MTQSIVKCSNWKSRKTFLFMSYVYFHFEAETINGFDCIEGNIYAFKDLMRGCLSVVTLLMKDNTTIDTLMIPCYSETRMQGLVCLCRDVEGVRDALIGYYSKAGIMSLSMYEHDIEFLKEYYLELYNLIIQIKRK